LIKHGFEFIWFVSYSLQRSYFHGMRHAPPGTYNKTDPRDDPLTDNIPRSAEFKYQLHPNAKNGVDENSLLFWHKIN
jgi:hypothetical protein